MKKFTCPYCYGIHDVLSCSLKCSYNVPGKTDKCITNVKKDANGWIETQYNTTCLKCKAARKSVFCSVVNKEIPSDFLNGPSFSVALLGAKASGKSNYIGVLVNEIKKKMTSSFNCTLSLTASEESKDYYNDNYYNPLFKQGYAVDATDKAIDIPPLIFPLRFMDKKNKITKVAALSFYDTAGENLDSSDQMTVTNQYISNANGIILLLDPLQVPSIREKLDGKVPLPEQNTDIVEILSRIVQNIRDVKNIKGKIKTPIALVFTKIDALEQFDVLRDDSSIRDESEHLKRGVFVKTDFDAVNIEIQDLLENWLDGELEQQLKSFERYAFFGISALGGSPDAKSKKLANGAINPKRVLDPLLWLLSENKFIKSVKK